MLPEAEKLLVALADAIRPAVTADTALVGIWTGGAWVAERLHPMLKIALPLGTLAVNFHRDDYSRIGLHRQPKPSQLPFDVAGRDIVLVDDVLFSGRTVRAAVNELFDFGRPKSVRLAVLVDRGGRELPIAAQFIGITADLAPTEELVLMRDGNRLAFTQQPKPESA
jgi:pyrimidine operon attenuation protein / uracil phosphoribosyltransferase